MRVCTTNNRGDQWNNVFSLDYYCRSYGVLTRIAPGEKIYSARYVDKRLYMVTFRQVDPFFVISFSSFRAPVVLGELKIPGYSTYLHPFDENTIIGFGRDANNFGVVGGLKAALFDVSNPRNPRQVSSTTINEIVATSTAEFEHKAFLFNRQREIMVVPAFLTGSVRFNGVIVFDVRRNFINATSLIDHLLNQNDNFDLRHVERSLYIENMLYTKSKCLLRINRIDAAYQAVTNINIPCRPTPTVRQNVVSPVIVSPGLITNPINSFLPAVTLPFRN